MFNLKDPKNPKLKGRVFNGDLTPADLVTSDPKQLASDEKKIEMEKTMKSNLEERRSDWAKE